jgi:serine protease Do
MGGPLSVRSADFPLVLQHDTVLRPIDCGGPVCDLSGKVVGVNIARAGRVESYAIPADQITGLLPDLMSGKLAPKEPLAKAFEKKAESPKSETKLTDSKMSDSKSPEKK